MSPCKHFDAFPDHHLAAQSYIYALSAGERLVELEDRFPGAVDELLAMYGTIVATTGADLIIEFYTRVKCTIDGETLRALFIAGATHYRCDWRTADTEWTISIEGIDT